jgi:uncharacterized protein
MKTSMHTISADSFMSMLTNLSQILDKGAAFARDKNLDLVSCRLAPDMYTLAQQVQQACHYAQDGMSRLAGRPAFGMGEVATTLSGLKDQIAKAVDFVGSVSDAEFEGAESRDCSIEIPNGRVIEMNGLRFLGSWTLPHFYFHVVTAYDILRHAGADIGKSDYLSQVGEFIRQGSR